ncbi:hypothetical protein [Azospirillum brasilense]|uniref:hypothetical protein n=1 Tax=Azospirillum brasilense TaxID=192 RepID=UPI000E67F5CE|nr:hypothetical protein [Azospirillum brasilense]NUB25743.1 hypothetical protein [Azospirillum brasilense]NUB33881.1 hypothetical protein [Azospirillum brasilense]RIW07745.1 hypothetical protein D2T81_02590 [Azospirillum brasilense]
MAILFMRTPEGGFLAGDTETGLTSYAFPTSTHATRARKHPAKIAAEMMASETASSRSAVPGAAARDAQWLEQLHAHYATDPVIATVTARCMVTLETLDALTRNHTCYEGFSELIGPEGSYRPTIRCDAETEPGIRAERIALANAYDVAREAQGESRRAYRG